MRKFLDQINNPKDLKKIKRNELPKVAEEIRKKLLEVISVNGGHLASNMGVVELTLALHYVFDNPVDKFVWDVGHQSYVHKLLTERKDRFHMLRQYEGLCGFTRREESPYDHWNCGHGGTSISAALAFATARDQKKEKNKVLAIIGDGSLTSGMALEGLNHTGHLKNDIIVVLNDNEMSIAPNVGGMSAHLSQIMTGQVMTKIKGEIDELLLAVPGIGRDISRYAHKIDEAIKGVFIPGRLFEDLGLRYIGPIDGHDVDLLIDSFDSIKDLKGPTLIHVITQKGKGYKVAEEKAHVWHGAKPFNIATGEFHKKKANPAYTAVFAEALIQLAKEDEKIIGLTAAMPDGTGIDKFEIVFPERTFDVGMAEQHCVGFAGALALEGLRPVAAIYSTFLQRAYDQVVHDICLMNIPITFAMDRAGIVGEDGSTHQGLYDIAYLRTLPNMVVMAPKDENELRHMLKTSVYHPSPSALRYPRGSALGVPIDPDMQMLEIGKAELIKDGKDLAIFAYGHMVKPSEKAAALLEEAGISIALINARFAKPVDSEMVLRYARSTNCLVTVEEHSLDGGFGSAVLEVLEQQDALANLRVKRIGVGNLVIEHGAPKIIRKNLKLDPEGLFETISEFYNKPASASVPENGKKGHARNGGKGRGKVGQKTKMKSKQPVHG
ncbi:MAG: 1-deoxy-D-xylulose-5-phosphate synthase [Nitrospinota bacterium]|nr:1-deoxy-D-xylulose-5-phosphate synthase [Nitrospinota bacterium]